LASGRAIDWALAESLAWGTLLAEGHPVRLSGQDCRRGTFSQRHAVLYDVETRERHIPLEHVAPGQATFRVYNSSLSEAAVLGFDYGYSLGAPDMLAMWEAQFGDFSNGAQVIIDQFIAAAESKWQTPSGIVLLLPHGHEGMGPEHSSARLERFLQLCADDNIEVANLSTPAQYFHILRRQLKRPFRKPLVLMTPKSLLTRPDAVSDIEDFLEGSCFQEILPDPMVVDDLGRVTRVVFCCGKVFHDLVACRAGLREMRTALLRIEQIHPLHEAMIEAMLSQYPAATKFVWCQEEPQNMGAWTFVAPRLERLTGGRLRYAGREAAASPATGAKAIHLREQQALVEHAFNV
jgi:2-oxoglutarate dehydrogenase E1 component